MTGGDMTKIQEELKQGLLRELKDEPAITPQLINEIKKWITQQLKKYEQESINPPQQ